MIVTQMAKKIRVVVLYGGKSGEHEVSLQSAASVIRHLDRERFDVIPVSISKTGRWQLGDLRLIDQACTLALPIPVEAPEVRLGMGASERSVLIPIHGGIDLLEFDVVFPVVHGPLCEDGTLQGLLELADVPYVGCGVLASAVSMDKDVAKRLAAQSGIPIAPYRALGRKAFMQDRFASLAKASAGLQLPHGRHHEPQNIPAIIVTADVSQGPVAQEIRYIVRDIGIGMGRHPRKMRMGEASQFAHQTAPLRFGEWTSPSWSLNLWWMRCMATHEITPP